INAPTRIGHVMVMPGDVVLGRNGGVIFIPPQLAEQVVKYSEETHLRDMFGHQRLQEGKYTAGQIDARSTGAIEQDYYQWMKQYERNGAGGELGGGRGRSGSVCLSPSRLCAREISAVSGCLCTSWIFHWRGAMDPLIPFIVYQ